MISGLLLRMSVLFALAGMAMGIVMGVTQDFALAPAHAHVNLLGFVAPFLAGLYYHVMPEAAASPAGKVHAWTAIIGAIVFPVGIAAETFQLPLRFLVSVGSMIVLTSMAVFAVVVFRHGATRKGDVRDLIELNDAVLKDLGVTRSDIVRAHASKR